jgi:hypothetical protein
MEYGGVKLLAVGFMEAAPTIGPDVQEPHEVPGLPQIAFSVMLLDRAKINNQKIHARVRISLSEASLLIKYLLSSSPFHPSAPVALVLNSPVNPTGHSRY